MSRNPLLDQLRGSVPDGGVLTLDALEQFLDAARSVDDNFFNFDEPTGAVNQARIGAMPAGE